MVRFIAPLHRIRSTMPRCAAMLGVGAAIDCDRPILQFASKLWNDAPMVEKRRRSIRLKDFDYSRPGGFFWGPRASTDVAWLEALR
jgi:hypothetical protein